MPAISEGRCDPAHVQRKVEGHDRGNVVSLTHRLHVELHQMGPESFQRKYGVDLTGAYDDPTDYERMCRSCHRQYDKARRCSA